MKMVLKLSIALTGAVGGVPLEAAAQVRVAREAYLMGTLLRAEVAAADRAVGIAALEGVFAEVRRLEEVLSSWRTDSELGRLNAAAVGEAVELSGELCALLDEVSEWTGRTGGAFDPAVGALVDAWDLRGAGRVPAAVELEGALAEAGLGRFRLDPARGTATRLAPGAWLDSGGFGKGAALRAAEAVLREAGVEAAYLDFGGQVLAYAEEAGGEGWEIVVARPDRREDPAAALRLRSGSVATSAQSERFVEVAGERIGHVLDPRTGRPVPAWGSVTVVAEDALVADVLSTALLVMGPEAGRRWAAERPEVGVLFLEVRGGEVVASWNAAFERYRVDH